MVRSRGLFQSLLSQGISLLFHANAGHGGPPFIMFQSLLSQGISLLHLDAMGDAKETYLFQSLLSQGISLLLDEFDHLVPSDSQRFNPFLVRASVYWKRFEWP